MAKRLKNTTDLRRYLANLINRAEKGDVDPNLAGKLGYLVSLLAKLIETSDLEQRLEVLEESFNNQKDGNVLNFRQDRG